MVYYANVYTLSNMLIPFEFQLQVQHFTPPCAPRSGGTRASAARFTPSRCPAPSWMPRGIRRAQARSAGTTSRPWRPSSRKPSSGSVSTGSNPRLTAASGLRARGSPACRPTRGVRGTRRVTGEQSFSLARAEEPPPHTRPPSRQLVTPRDTRLRRAGDLIRITILDHIILGDGRTVSVADPGGHREAILPQRCL